MFFREMLFQIGEVLDDVIYGIIPRPKTLLWLKVPPLNIRIISAARPKTLSSPVSFTAAVTAVGSTPGSGM
ncbi:MAG: hypothetical protein R6W74_07525 [Nitrosomonas halophila]